MQREILFRALKDDMSDCCFVYGTLTHSADGIPIIFEHQGSYLTTHCIKGTVGQFTGLTDKNGNKIFEGDILFYNGITSSGKPFERTVFFDTKNGQFRAGMYDLDMSIEYAEIIGNIHEK